jgi:Flp pilus assembly protein TadG
MRMNHLSVVRKAFYDQRGQVLPWAAFMMLTFLGMGGMVVDVGRAYVMRVQLQNAANAAALAAAGEVYDTSSTYNSSTVATSYSGSSSDANSGIGVSSVSTAVSTVCLNLLMPTGTTCGTSSPANAVKVTETGTVKTYFMPIVFGPTSLSVKATATASMQGAPQAWNVAIVLDGTTSMGGTPPSGSCSGYTTEYACAMAGVTALLGHVNPCSGVASCSATTAKFRVALFQFPNVKTSNVADYWTCGGTPTPEPYTLPDAGLSGYTTLTYNSIAATYEATPVATGDGDANGFVYDYWSGSTSNYLNTSSDLTKGVTGCLTNPGGESTYYAGVIYAAQNALKAEAALHSGSKNAMIILSDGQANATSSKFPSTSASPSADGYSGTAMTSTGVYPSVTDQCQQAITAAQNANTAGTKVYTVAFNSESDGCAVSGSGVTVTDTSLTATATSGQPALSLSTLTPCIVMKNMASPSTATMSYFYADTSSASSGCTDTAHTTGTIANIFDAIAATFTSPRLLPNNAT